MKGLVVGQSASLTRTFTAEDIAAYAALSGDTRALISVPGPLLGGLFSNLLGTRLPGRGTNWLKQSFKFVAPAPIGEVITATVEITRLRPDKALVNLHGTCVTAEGHIVCEAESLVLVKDLEV